MRIELCTFSGFKIYPGHGRKYVRTDGRAMIYINKKSEKSHAMKRNPREITWTLLYRRKYKKGHSDESSRKRNRRTTKFQRGIVGASLSDILAKRNQKPEVRKAQREQAIRAAKEKQKAKDAQKKTTKPAAQKSAPKHKAAKQAPVSKARVGAKR